METHLDHFICLWCGDHFERRYLMGRKPCYCRRTCRQRAYEARRRAALVARHPKAPPTPPSRRSLVRYEAGQRYGITHALRPDALPDRIGRRGTLCGTYASAIRPPFGTLDARRRNCLSCERIAQRHPPPRAIDPPRDVAVLTNLARRLQVDLLTGTPTNETASAVVAFCWPDARDGTG
jgi:hypothetical protein